MYIRNFSKTYKNVDKEAVWRILTDINNWASWHGDLDYCKLEGSFEVGNHFMLKPKGVKPVKIELTEIEKGRSFTDCTTFFGAKMYDTHEIEETAEGVRLTNKLVVKGPLTWLWVKLVARDVADSVEEENETLIKLARAA